MATGRYSEALSVASSAPPETDSVQLEIEAKAETSDSPPPGPSGLSSKKALTKYLGKLVELENNWHLFFAVICSCYFVYRSQGKPTFTTAPFSVGLNDAWGVLFLAAFAVTRRRTYLVFLINPLRNVLLLLAH